MSGALEVSRNRLHRTGGNALLTNNAARSSKGEPERLGIQAKGFGRANAGTETAMHAAFFIDQNFPAGHRDVDILRAHPF